MSGAAPRLSPSGLFLGDASVFGSACKIRSNVPFPVPAGAETVVPFFDTVFAVGAACAPDLASNGIRVRLPGVYAIAQGVMWAGTPGPGTNDRRTRAALNGLPQEPEALRPGTADADSFELGFLQAFAITATQIGAGGAAGALVQLLAFQDTASDPLDMPSVFLVVFGVGPL